MPNRHRRLSSTALFLSAGLGLASTAGATVMTVDTTLDDYQAGANGNCSLREAVIAANTNAPVDACPAGSALPTVDEIVLPAGFYELSSLPGFGLTDPEVADLNVYEDLTITGAGADATVIDASPLFASGTDMHHRLLTVHGVAVTTLEGVTMQGGRMLLGAGGALSVGNGGGPPHGSLFVVDSQFSDNWALAGGAIQAIGGTLVLDRSTVENNLAAYYGGGLYVSGDTSVTIRNSTLSGNSVDDPGGHGGALTNGGNSSGASTLTILHTTITDNTAGLGSAVSTFPISGSGSTTFVNSILDGDCYHSPAAPFLPPISSGSNLESPGNTCALTQSTDQVNVPDVMLGALQYNAGGSTETHALLVGSPAIDAVPGLCLASDQNGTSRSGLCDSGSVEYVSGGGCSVASTDTGGAHELALLAIPAIGLVLRRRRQQICT